jgi:hypothetical protein
VRGEMDMYGYVMYCYFEVWYFVVQLRVESKKG